MYEHLPQDLEQFSPEKNIEKLRIFVAKYAVDSYTNKDDDLEEPIKYKENVYSIVPKEGSLLPIDSMEVSVAFGIGVDGGDYTETNLSIGRRVLSLSFDGGYFGEIGEHQGGEDDSLSLMNGDNTPILDMLIANAILHELTQAEQEGRITKTQ